MCMSATGGIRADRAAEATMGWRSLDPGPLQEQGVLLAATISPALLCIFSEVVLSDVFCISPRFWLGVLVSECLLCFVLCFLCKTRAHCVAPLDGDVCPLSAKIRGAHYQRCAPSGVLDCCFWGLI